MFRESYRGVKIQVQKGREYGTSAVTIGGEPKGSYMSQGKTESEVSNSWKGYIDDAGDRPDAYPVSMRPTLCQDHGRTIPCDHGAHS